MAKIAAIKAIGIDFNAIGQAITQNGTTGSQSSSGQLSGFTVGKTYIIGYDRNTNNAGGVASGADVLGSNTYKRTGGVIVNILLIKATSTTITFLGNNNPIFYAQLD